MKQITILSEGGADAIADITLILAEAGIDIDSITGENYGRRAVVTVTVRDYDAALNALQVHENLQVVSEDALIVRVPDEVGALAKISRRFSDAGIHIRSIRFVERHNGFSLVAIATERTEEALKLVGDILVS